MYLGDVVLLILKLISNGSVLGLQSIHLLLQGCTCISGFWSSQSMNIF